MERLFGLRSRLASKITAAALATLVLAGPVPAVGGEVSLLFQSRADRAGGTEVFYSRWNSLSDFTGTNVGGTNASLATFLALNVTSDYNIAGFGVADNKPHLLFESREDRAGGTELFLAGWNSMSDFLGTNVGGTNASFATFLALNVTSDYNIAGFDIADNKPYLLFESREDRAGGTELFLAGWNSMSDFIGTNVGGTNASFATFLALNVTSDYRIVGFDIADSEVVNPPPGTVPEPGTLALLGLGLAGLAGMRRRKQ